jgi:hypothetical protein
MEVEIIAFGVWQFAKNTNIAPARKKRCAIERNFFAGRQLKTNQILVLELFVPGL